MNPERPRRRVAAEDDLPRAVRRWSRTDPVMARLARAHPPGERPIGAQAPFAALVTSLLHQQVSLAAGRTIASRVEAACGGRVTPEAVLRLGPEKLRPCGLSGQKTRYVLDLAEKTVGGEVDFARLVGLSDADAIAELTKVKGVGVWTAQMYLLFHLARPDVVAPDDLGLQIAAARAYRVPRERARALLETRAPRWSPFGSLASLVLWQSRRDHLERASTRKARPAPSRRRPS